MRFALAAGLVLLAVPLAAQEAPTFDEIAVLRARADLLDGRVEEAVAVLQPAAEAGNPRAQAMYGSIFEYGDTGVFDAKQAIHWYELAADQGYPQAMYLLGSLHRYGMEGFEPDPEKARDWLERAIAQDNIAAFAELGDMLYWGMGVPEDTETGLVYLRRAADAGDPDASLDLGMAYHWGQGVSKDEVEARRLFMISASFGDYRAQNELGYMATYGLGGPVDVILAEEMLQAAVEQGFDLAGQSMSDLIRRNPEVAEGDARIAAAAYCVWAMEHATEHDPEPENWRPDCEALLEGYSEAELKEADRMAGSLVPAP
jgi:TPR repeat protein